MDTLQELSEMTQKTKKLIEKDGTLVPIDESAPEPVRKYGAVTWLEDCFYHTLIGEIPEPGIWTIGRTKEESWDIFTKEFNQRVQPDGTLKPFSNAQYKNLFPPDFNFEAFLENCNQKGWNKKSDQP